MSDPRANTLSLALLALALAGCPSMTTLGSARTLERGRAQLLIAPGPEYTPGAGLKPQLEVAVRYGVTDRFELGVKAWLAGFLLEGKLGLLRPASADSGFNLSLAPGAGCFATADGEGVARRTTVITSFYLPLLFGFRFHGHELVLGPRLVEQLLWTRVGGWSRTSGVLLAGTSVGFSIKVSESFRLMPEVAALVVVAPPAGSLAGPGAPLFQAGLGFLFGRS